MGKKNVKVFNNLGFLDVSAGAIIIPTDKKQNYGSVAANPDGSPLVA
jgi:hypothetical protein